MAVCGWSTGIAQVANTSEGWWAGVLIGRQVEVTWAGMGKRSCRVVSGFSQTALYTVAVLSEGAPRESRG